VGEVGVVPFTPEVLGKELKSWPSTGFASGGDYRGVQV